MISSVPSRLIGEEGREPALELGPRHDVDRQAPLESRPRANSSGSPKEPVPRRSSVGQSERESVKDLPDLMDRIHQMGLTEEYVCFRERYLGWRQGQATGATGDLSEEGLNKKIGKGFGYWYPSVSVWQWRRTLSYWIAVTFFEGSLFFTISSFAWTVPDRLGRLKSCMTTWGYVAGKVNFLICTYLMCVETINLSNDEWQHAETNGEDDHSMSSESSESEGGCCPGDTHSGARSARSGRGVGRHETRASLGVVVDKEEAPFKKWPFHYRTAIKNLKSMGAGPWPYYASAIYLIGVLTFTIGLIAEFMPESVLPEEAASETTLVTFVFGSLFFTLGGAAECIENKVFSSCLWTSGYVGAFLNLIGGVLFLTGAILGFIPDLLFESMFSYGCGSVTFALGSAVMIIMWKDEQFGLTFLAVLNNLGGDHGRPLIRGHERPEEEKTFSLRGACFIMVYCLTATLSTYDFFISLSDYHGFNTSGRVLGRSFNSLLPCIFAHFMLALNAGVYKTPNVQPFHTLYIACRWIALIMCVNSAFHVFERLEAESQGVNESDCVRL